MVAVWGGGGVNATVKIRALQPATLDVEVKGARAEKRLKMKSKPKTARGARRHGWKSIPPGRGHR